MNKLLIVTGASKGIGKSTAAYFLKQQWDVINISRSPCDLENVRNLHVDFSIPDSVEIHAAKLPELVTGYNKVCLLHNAASYVKDSCFDIEAESLRNAFEVNVLTPSLMNKVLLPHLPQGSSIIFIGSTLSEKAVANAASYAITKHAVAGLMKATCQDLMGTGIHTCCICPGFTDTEMLRAHVKHDENILAAIKSYVGENRLIEPDEIAKTIFFAVNNPVINGSVMHANLGQIES